VLDWALNLQKAGIMGSEVGFNAAEKQKPQFNFFSPAPTGILRAKIRYLREGPMTRRRILIVEDAILPGDECASHVENAGFEVAGPYSNLKDVPEDLAGIEGAILDINVGGASAYRLIDRLLEMNIPVILYTGCNIRHDPRRYATLPRVSKPNSYFDAVRELIRQLAN
jgi:hypothetical protein